MLAPVLHFVSLRITKRYRGIFKFINEYLLIHSDLFSRGLRLRDLALMGSVNRLFTRTQFRQRVVPPRCGSAPGRGRGAGGVWAAGRTQAGNRTRWRRSEPLGMCRRGKVACEMNAKKKHGLNNLELTGKEVCGGTEQ